MKASDSCTYALGGTTAQCQRILRKLLEKSKLKADQGKKERDADRRSV